MFTAISTYTAMSIFPLMTFNSFIFSTTTFIFLLVCTLRTTGSKNIPEYVYITDYKERVYLRLLPNPEMLQSAIEAGIMPSHLIGMQGPFSQELNEAVIRQFDIGVLVTKESGSNGGYEEKVSATENTGIDCIVIKRPVEENGVSLPELIKYLKTKGL